MSRLVVSDVDGTLVRSDKSLAPATVAAAQRLIAEGGQMTLISARPPSGILPLARQMGLPGPFGAFNGGTIFAADGAVLDAHRLDAEVSRRAVEAIAPHRVTIWLFADGRWFSTDDTNPHTDAERRSTFSEPVLVSDFEALHGRVDKIVAVCDDPDLMARLSDDVSAALGDGAEVALSQTYYCDITHPEANKGAGVARLAEALGVALADTVVIGDMPNDLPMFRRAGHAIAMGQAPQRVRDAASAVTASNDEDGVARAIEGLIGPR
ncbi:HAD family hydrolase [Sphingomonas morindae]|uniref:HAD family hydrolase n=1 Tax=Sphingomonas morindae TaxID=1541170 RepID=A0ABY4X6B3_9SPHN|nr:HAD family hydrolase [Sphingomonas morindae]USI72416.1 HAD family hydrolase [Sphingomonas morindae]